MKLEFEKVGVDLENSFLAYEYEFTEREQAFHLHEEYELAAVDGCGGLITCGSDTTEFLSGDLFLFGRRLPHRFSRISGTGDGRPRARVLQFRQNALGDGFFNLPENRNIKRLLGKASDGMVFRGFSGNAIAEIIGKKGARRFTGLLELLADLVELEYCCEYETLTSGILFAGVGQADTRRLSALQEYIESEYVGDSSLSNAADRLALTPTSFCRFVKRCTGRTYTDLVNDYRLSVSAILLRDTQLAVSVISVDSGFGNLSHFNALFRDRFGMTPTEFRHRLNR